MTAPTARLDLIKLAHLTFEAPDEVRFPALRIAREAMERGDTAPAVLNAANEIAVAAFLEGRIGFAAIPALVEETLAVAEGCGCIIAATTLEDVLSVDQEARRLACALLSGKEMGHVTARFQPS